MKIENMRYIIEVSKYKSINKASKNLFMNQRQLSRLIALTEEELEVKIFERTPKGVIVTPAGREVIKKFKVILDAYDSLQSTGGHAEKSNLSGKISILSDVSIWHGLVSLGEEFMKQYPKIGFSLESMASENIIRYLHHREGIGEICRVVRDDVPDFNLAPDWSYRMLSCERLEVYGRPENPIFRQYKTISLHTLLSYPLAVYKPYNDENLSVVERIFQPIGMPNLQYEVSDFRVFWSIMKETDCLFLTIKRPSYVSLQHLIGMPVRDNVKLEYGILCNPGKKCELYNAFDEFHASYYKKLEEF